MGNVGGYEEQNGERSSDAGANCHRLMTFARMCILPGYQFDGSTRIHFVVDEYLWLGSRSCIMFSVHVQVPNLTSLTALCLSSNKVHYSHGKNAKAP